MSTLQGILIPVMRSRPVVTVQIPANRLDMPHARLDLPGLGDVLLGAIGTALLLFSTLLLWTVISTAFSA